MKPRKLAGWALLAIALALMVFGDFGPTTVLSSLLKSFAAMGLLGVGLVLVAM